MMALKGIRVIEMAGLAPGPFCGLILSDFGARVIRVERPESKTFALDRLTRGKESIVIDLNKNKGQSLFLDLCGRSDVLIGELKPELHGRKSWEACAKAGGSPFAFCTLTTSSGYFQCTKVLLV